MPLRQSATLDGPHELGLKFTSDVDGEVTHIRYFRVAEETGKHVGRLWDKNGAELAGAAFAGESASGWQEVVLDRPVRIKAGEMYVVSVNGNKAYAASKPQASQFAREDALEILEKAYHQAKALDPTRLIHASDGGDLQKWTDVASSGGGDQFGPKPYLFHEYGNYTCSLPDFALIPRLTGVIRPVHLRTRPGLCKEHGLNGRLSPVLSKFPGDAGRRPEALSRIGAAQRKQRRLQLLARD